MRPLGTVSVLVGIASGLWACGGGSPGGSSASPPPQASPAATATAEISTSAGTAINPGYGGYNLAMVWYGVSYRDANFRAAAAALSAGWLRFPAGTGSLAFDWTTGLSRPEWAARFVADAGTYDLLQGALATLGGKGGDRIQDFAQLAAALGAKAVLCVNAATDTPQSAGALAAWAKANGLNVTAYELTNEPYLYPDFFGGGADYAAKMKPYRNAIKAADPSAVVALFFKDGSGSWNTSLGSYSDHYWDAVVLHHYPAVSQGTAFADAMSAMNADLQNAAEWITSEVIPKNPAGTKVLVSEFGPGGQTSPLPGSLYAGIYSAEYLTRLSVVPQMLHVGHHQLCAENGINWTYNHTGEVVAAYNAGRTVDPTTYNWGFFPSAQVLGAAVANGALKHAAQALATTCSGGSTVHAGGLGEVAALHAQAYAGADGREYLVVTNKGASSETLLIRVNGTPVSETLNTSFVTGSDPAAVNSPANPSLVRTQSSTTGNPVTVPPYSVLRVDWGP